MRNNSEFLKLVKQEVSLKRAAPSKVNLSILKDVREQLSSMLGSGVAPPPREKITSPFNGDRLARPGKNAMVSVIRKQWQ